MPLRMSKTRVLLLKIGIPKLKEYYLYLRSADALADFLMLKYKEQEVYITGQAIRDFIRRKEPDFFKQNRGWRRDFRGGLKHYHIFALYRIYDLLEWESKNCQKKDF